MSVNTVEKILKLIKEKEITQKKFLSDLGLDETKLAQWKSGQTQSYKKYIHKIADYFSVPTDYLLRDEWEAPADKLEWADLDVSFYEGVDKLTDDEKREILNYINYKISERKKDK